jgi:hypothetical protein
VRWMPKYMVIALLIFQGNSAFAFDLCHDHGVEHKPRAGVIYGEEVQAVPDPIEIPITIDMAERYGIDMPAGALLESNMGMMAIYNDGRIVYNNRDISGSIKDTCDDDSGSKDTTEQPEENKDSDNTDAGRELPRMVPIGDQGQ